MTAYPQFNAMALPRYPFGEIHQTATQTNNDGDVVQLGSGLFGVVSGLGAGTDAIAVGDPVCFKIVGIYDLLKNSTTDTYADGAPVYWDTTNNVAKTAAGSGINYIGFAVGATASGTSRVRVMLNGDYSILNSTTVTFTGATGGNSIVLPDNLAQAVLIKDAASNVYATVVSTTGALEWVFGQPIGLTTGTLAAAGTSSSGQGQIVNQVTTVTAANGTKAVKLPSPAAFGFCVVINTVTTALLPVCQNASENIDGVAGPLNIPGGTRSIFWSDGTNWWSLGTIDTSSLPDYATVAAAGSSQSNAAAINARIVTITGADGTKGVKLPAPAAGLEIIVVHTVGTKSLPVYGNGSETINGVAGATGVSVLGGSSPIFRSDGTNWFVAGTGWDYGLQPYASIAAAGTNQGSATLISSQRVIVTAANGTKGVYLPAPAPGLEIELYNSVAASTLHVYGNSTENVQGIGGATGIVVTGGTHLVIKSDGTNWFVEGVGWDFALQTFVNVSASQTSGQSNATLLTARTNLIGTSAGAGYVKMPAVAAGVVVTTINATSQTVTLYGNGSETINGTAGGTGISLTTGKSITLTSDGTNWYGQAAS